MESLVTRWARLAEEFPALRADAEDRFAVARTYGAYGQRQEEYFFPTEDGAWSALFRVYPPESDAVAEADKIAVAQSLWRATPAEVETLLCENGAASEAAAELVALLGRRLSPREMHTWLADPDRAHPVPDPESEARWGTVLNWTPINAVSARQDRVRPRGGTPVRRGRGLTRSLR